MRSCRKATTKTWGSWTERLAARTIPVMLVAGALATGVVTVGAQKKLGAAQATQAQADQTGAFMRAKLTHSQHVLEGLAVEDYDLIAKGAQQLALASQASDWQVLQTEDYIRHSSEFRRACDNLGATAKAKNLDGAALAWMEVTLKCVQCHRYVRDQNR